MFLLKKLKNKDIQTLKININSIKLLNLFNKYEKNILLKNNKKFKSKREINENFIIKLKTI